MNLLRSVLAVSLLAAAGASQAVVVDWGVHEEYEDNTGYETVAAGSVEDFYTFSLDLETTGDLNASAVALKNKKLIGLVDAEVELFKGVYGDAEADESFGAFSFDYSSGDNEYLIQNLVSGDYYYKVTGNATGSLGGKYLFSSSLVTAPIPEPETYAMLAAGLGAIVVARRAKKA